MCNLGTELNYDVISGNYLEDLKKNKPLKKVKQPCHNWNGNIYIHCLHDYKTISWKDCIEVKLHPSFSLMPIYCMANVKCSLWWCLNPYWFALYQIFAVLNLPINNGVTRVIYRNRTKLWCNHWRLLYLEDLKKNKPLKKANSLATIGMATYTFTAWLWDHCLKILYWSKATSFILPHDNLLHGKCEMQPLMVT